MRLLSALLLSLTLALSSVSMAIARGQSAQGMELTLCTPDGVQTVVLDAQGNPVPATPHLCPDCLSGVLALDLPPPLALPVRPAVWSALPPLPVPTLRADRKPRVHPARGPPLSV